MKTKIRLFVPCPYQDKGHHFPKIRLVVLLRAFMEASLRETTEIIDAEWPKHKRDNFDYHSARGAGIRLTLITDDSGLGRVFRVMQKHESMGFVVEDCTELGHATFAYAYKEPAS